MLTGLAQMAGNALDPAMRANLEAQGVNIARGADNANPQTLQDQSRTRRPRAASLMAPNRELPSRPALTIPSKATDPQSYQLLVADIMGLLNPDQQVPKLIEGMIALAAGPVQRPKKGPKAKKACEDAYPYLMDWEVDSLPAYTMLCMLIKSGGYDLNGISEEVGKSLLHVSL